MIAILDLLITVILRITVNIESDSILIAFRNLILAKFKKKIILYFGYFNFVDVKKIKDQTKSVQITRI